MNQNINNERRGDGRPSSTSSSLSSSSSSSSSDTIMAKSAHSYNNLINGKHAAETDADDVSSQSSQFNIPHFLTKKSASCASFFLSSKIFRQNLFVEDNTIDEVEVETDIVVEESSQKDTLEKNNTLNVDNDDSNFNGNGQSLSTPSSTPTSPPKNSSTIYSAKLRSVWTLWWHNQLEMQGNVAYRKQLKKLGTCRVVRSFASMYRAILPPSQLEKGVHYHLFKGAKAPCRERYPEGGMLVVQVDPEAADELWERVLFACIGATLDTNGFQGVEGYMMGGHFVLRCWFKSQTNVQDLKREVNELVIVPVGMKPTMTLVWW
eukprot:m.135888 g.135888  ORF g.135888 m.135888 type:complete len:320 (+) comp10278_c0_seq1:141-1100(+)